MAGLGVAICSCNMLGIQMYVQTISGGSIKENKDSIFFISVTHFGIPYLCTLNLCKIKRSSHSDENDKAIKDKFCRLQKY